MADFLHVVYVCSHTRKVPSCYYVVVQEIVLLPRLLHMLPTPLQHHTSLLPTPLQQHTTLLPILMQHH